MSVFDAVKVLLRIIDSLRQIDHYGYFTLPVTEDEAPGYYSVIEKGMSFSMMREKVENCQYRTWGGFLSDFNLMVCNAMHFNDKKSVVYRVACQLSKEGNERLQEVDLEGRQAIYLSHSEGPGIAAIEEAREFRLHGLPIPMNPFLMIPSSLPKREHQDSPDEELEECEDEYSSFSETDSEGEARGHGCPSLTKIDSTLNVSPLKGVVCLPWDQSRCQWSVAKNLRPEMELGEDWEKMKSDLEWKSRWLSFRIKELTEHLARYSMDEEVMNSEEMTRYRYERVPIPGIDNVEALLEHPFFRRHCSLESEEKINLEKEQDEDSCEDESYPARLYLSLGILAEEAPKLLTLLSARQRISQTRTQPSLRPLPKKAQTPRRKPSSQGIMESKRIRRAFDLDPHQSISFSSGVSGTMEKPLRLNIRIPNVTPFTPEQVDTWESARKLTKERIQLGLALQLPEPIKKSLFLLDEEGSSEEDISDEAYLEKHKQMEVAERERHLCVFGPSDGKLLPVSEKLPKKHPSQSIASPLSHSLRRGRGRLKGSRPVGRPPLVSLLHSPQLTSCEQFHRPSKDRAVNPSVEDPGS